VAVSGIVNHWSVTDGAGHFGWVPFALEAEVPFLVAEVLAEELADAARAAELLDTGLGALDDLALLVLDNDAKVLALLLALGLGVDEPLEALLLALKGSEGLGVALGQLGVELGVVERGRAKVGEVHAGCTKYPLVSRKSVLAARVRSVACSQRGWP
jgi:hypothetical protein